ncbi:CHAP domain-containing protein [Nocardioides sp. YIM 152315]|uniref:CHAP domain-containing protein n=1 Tax=Nocardioides sp. YIM 152315 TaxID=3031760 RepID=UPI0023DCC2BB|nr:CHAP domain-containing protein [Nocardioides sp. YIM 152315]MDF1605677.1 CHAP domain-containing protein [Nocardioides sp. YIM 152315]
MSSPFTTPWRLALASPLWPFLVVMAVGIGASAIAAERAEGRSVELAPAAFHAERVVKAKRIDRRPARPAPPLASSNAVQTVAAAKSSAVNVPGQCLEWAREQAGVPSRYADATTAWRHARGRHPGDASPPRGAAVYWTGGSNGYGHVAISLGNGLVRSSDAGGAGTVGTVPLRYFDRQWDLEYAGWASSINGYTIPGVATT